MSEPAYAGRPIGGERKKKDRKKPLFNDQDQLCNGLKLSKTVGARGSKLSRLQVEEMEKELQKAGIPVVFSPVWIETYGDRDRKTSLKTMGRIDFFTREIDRALLSGEIDLAVHSAKDLPDPLPAGISLLYLTEGIDPRDALVIHPRTALDELPPGARIGTSSLRREELASQIRPDFTFVDIRGTIEERLSLLEKQEIDGVVVAEAALIRLGLTFLHRIYLPGPTAPGQGKLALLGRDGTTLPRT